MTSTQPQTINELLRQCMTMMDKETKSIDFDPQRPLDGEGALGFLNESIKTDIKRYLAYREKRITYVPLNDKTSGETTTKLTAPSLKKRKISQPVQRSGRVANPEGKLASPERGPVSIVSSNKSVSLPVKTTSPPTKTIKSTPIKAKSNPIDSKVKTIPIVKSQLIRKSDDLAKNRVAVLMRVQSHLGKSKSVPPTKTNASPVKTTNVHQSMSNKLKTKKCNCGDTIYHVDMSKKLKTYDDEGEPENHDREWKAHTELYRTKWEEMVDGECEDQCSNSTEGEIYKEEWEEKNHSVYCCDLRHYNPKFGLSWSDG